MLRTVESMANKTEVINTLKQKDKKTERVIKSPAFLFTAAIWSH